MTICSARVLAAFATLLLLAAAGTAMAETPPSRAALINTCIRDIRSGLKAGQTMTNSQRMMAEERCRAYAESQLREVPVQPSGGRQTAADKPAAAGNAKAH